MLEAMDDGRWTMDAAHLENLHSIHTPRQAACCTSVVLARNLFIVLFGGGRGRELIYPASVGKGMSGISPAFATSSMRITTH